MLNGQKAYIFAWMDGVTAAGYRPGIYCSGTHAREDDRGITTAGDIREGAGGRKIRFWVYNTAIPPSPGCTFHAPFPAPSMSGIHFAEVWQFAQSPAPANTSGTRGYSADGRCYAPGLSHSEQIHIDLDSATSPDPSRGR